MIPNLKLDDIQDGAIKTALKQIDEGVTGLQRSLSDVAAKSGVPMHAGGGGNPFIVDNSGGTAGATITVISDAATRNAIATLAKSINTMIAVMQQLARVQP